MDIGFAMNRLRKGKFSKREHWAKEEFLYVKSGPILKATAKGTQPYMANGEDLLAEDWMGAAPEMEPKLAK